VLAWSVLQNSEDLIQDNQNSNWVCSVCKLDKLLQYQSASFTGVEWIELAEDWTHWQTFILNLLNFLIIMPET